MPHRQRRNANAAPPQPRRRRSVRRPAWVGGTLVELDPDGGRLTVRVQETRGTRFATDAELSVETSDAVLRATDGDGDGRPGITDLFPGDELRIELAPAEAGQPPAATRITQRSMGAPPGGLRRLWGR